MINGDIYKVSFIVPVYNVENYIEECLSSIFEISSFSYELIVVNDGSTDDSMIKVRNMCLHKDNVSYIEQENRGLSAARNAGMAVARGEYLYFIDSDDKISASNLQILIEKITGKEDVVIANFYKFTNLDVILNKNRMPDGLLQEGSFFLLKYYLKDIYTVVWRNIYRKEFLKKYSLQFMEGVTYEDVEWAPRVLFYASCVVYYDIPIYFYRKREGSIVNSLFSRKKFEDILKVGYSLLAFTSQIPLHQKKIIKTIHESVAFFVLLALINMHRQYPCENIYNGIKLLLSLNLGNLKYILLRCLFKFSPALFWYVLDKKFE